MRCAVVVVVVVVVARMWSTVGVTLVRYTVEYVVALSLLCRYKYIWGQLKYVTHGVTCHVPCQGVTWRVLVAYNLSPATHQDCLPCLSTLGNFFTRLRIHCWLLATRLLATRLLATRLLATQAIQILEKARRDQMVSELR